MKVLGLVSYPILPAKMGGQKGIALFYKYFSREIAFISVSIRKNQPALAEGYELLNVLSDGPSRSLSKGGLRTWSWSILIMAGLVLY
jgi:polysaccharide biosynthesis protein PslH